MKTTETNKKFAEFLEWETNEYEVKIPYQMANEQIRLLPMEDLKYQADISDLGFHYDWNWLMLVVDKIESLTYRVRFEMETCFILNDDFETIIESTGSERSKIEAVYNACNAFIDWYNSNKG